MRSVLISAIGATIVVLLATLAPADEPDMSFQRSMDMLDVELKLQALKRLKDIGFFLSPQLADRYLKEQQNLAAEMKVAAVRDLNNVDAWKPEVSKVKAAEKAVLEKAAETWMIKILKKATAAEGDEKNGVMTFRQIYQQQADQLKFMRTDKARASAVLQYLEELTGNPELNLRSARMMNDGWRESMRQTYRGIIKDRTRLLEGVVKLEQQRMKVEAAMESLKWINKWTGRIEKLRQLEDAPGSLAYDEGEKRVLAYLKTRYPEASVDNGKLAFDEAKKLFNTAKGAYDKVKGLSADPNLKAHPKTVKMAQQFAVMAAVFKYSVGQVKKLPAAKALGPLFDVLDFYGEAIGLVSTVAQKMASVFARAEQDDLGLRGDNTWARIYNEQGEISKTNLFKAKGIQIASKRPSDGRLADRYYLVVAKEVIARGYATLSKAEYLRLERAVSAERIVMAVKETWRSIAGVAWEAVFGETTDTPFSTNAGSSYASKLKKNAAKQPFSDAQLLALAHNQTIEYKSAKWNVDKFVSRADTKLDSLADELAVRQALDSYSHAGIKKWWAFREVLGKYRVALSTRQILALFRAYGLTGDKALVERILKKKARERAARRLGVPMVGVPLVTIPSSTPEDVDTVSKKRRTARIEATVITGELAPGRYVAADVIWVLPTWAKGRHKIQRVMLSNGLHKVYNRITVPKNVDDKSFTVKVAVEILPDETHENTISAVGIGYFDIGKKKSRDPVEYMWVLKEGYPKRDPDNRKDWNWEHGNKQDNWYLQKIDFTHSSANVHLRRERGGKVEYDWKFSFSVSGTPPKKLYAGDTFTMSIKGNAGGEKKDYYVGAGMGIAVDGMYIVSDPPSHGRADRTGVTVGRSGSTGKVAESDSVTATIIVSDDHDSDLVLTVFLGGKGVTTQYVYQRVPVEPPAKDQ